MSNEEQPVSLVKRVLIFGLLAGFLIMGILSMKRAIPENKEERIYQAIKAHSPYQFEKRLGGLTILDSRDPEHKEKPSAAEVLFRMDELDKKWAKTHLVVQNNDVVITKEDNSTVKIFIETPQERAFVKSFFGI